MFPGRNHPSEGRVRILNTIKQSLRKRRASILTAPCNLNQPGIEIGPSFQPIVPKSDGHPVIIVDHLDQEGLRRKYANADGIDIKRIEPVDHVWDGRPIDQLIGEHGRFHWIIASHVAEHLPDLLGFLKASSNLLTEQGLLALALPDMRYTLDLERPASGLATVIDAHLRDDKRPSPGVLAELHIRARLRGSRLSWRPWNVLSKRAAWPIQEAKDVFATARNSEEYIDGHVWCFSPKSFQRLIEELNSLGELDLEIQSIRPRWGLEFFVWLRKKTR